MRIVLHDVSYWRLVSNAQRDAESLQSASWQCLSALVKGRQRLWCGKCSRRRELLVHQRYRRGRKRECSAAEFLDTVQATASGVKEQQTLVGLGWGWAFMRGGVCDV